MKKRPVDRCGHEEERTERRRRPTATQMEIAEHVAAWFMLVHHSRTRIKTPAGMCEFKAAALSLRTLPVSVTSDTEDKGGMETSAFRGQRHVLLSHCVAARTEVKSEGPALTDGLSLVQRAKSTAELI